MSKFESSVKQIPYSQQTVYNNLSDLSNLERVRDRIPADKVNDFSFDHDTVSVNVPPVGVITMQVIERDEPKCVKFETVKSPVPFNLWIQILPVTDTECKIKLTIEATLNPFIKGMVAKPLQEGIEKIADTLALLHYS